MDTSASSNIDATYRAVYKFLLIGSSTFPSRSNHRNTVIKYTKLPDLDSDTVESWPNELCDPRPRFRRTVSLVDPEIKSSRSVKSSNFSKPASNVMTPNCTKRKIVTISEDDEGHMYSKFSSPKNCLPAKTPPNSRRPTSPEKKPAAHRTSRLNGSQKPATDSKLGAKLNSKKDTNDVKPYLKRKTLSYQIVHEIPKSNRMIKDKDSLIHHSKALQAVPKAAGSKRLTPGRSAIDIPVTKYNENLNLTLSPTKSLERSKLTTHKFSVQKEKNVSTKQKPSNKLKKNTVVHVPLEAAVCYMENSEKEYLKSVFEHVKKIDSGTGPDLQVSTKDAYLCTEIAATVNKETETRSEEVGTMFRGFESICSQTHPVESLVIPNVSLTKDRDDSLKNTNEQKSVQTDPLSSLTVENVACNYEHSLNDKNTQCETCLQGEDICKDKVVHKDKYAYNGAETCIDKPARNAEGACKDEATQNNENTHNDKATCNEEAALNDEGGSSNIYTHNNGNTHIDEDAHINGDGHNDRAAPNDYANKQISPYIIGHATLTYTTEQKINFHMIGKEDSLSLTTNSLSYPINVVSVYKKETSNCEMTNITTKDSNKNKRKNNIKFLKDLNRVTSLNCSYVFNCHKLVKPSDIISTMRINSQLFQNDDICEQFQRELNFIDSFFESLQYLESCSLTDRCFSDNKVENWISNSGLGLNKSLLSQLGNGANFEDSETMASKSLCLLNLLIRDEQRRAKNLLFVLKMREDALKDFTKSQILWLENKKKQDNTDISTLKKKQRGALLKLQHECGEMQRMRKALLTLSERRKVALMKTKKNIELKLRNSADVDQIILGKKKLKRSSSDRNIAPVKCFDLSSSGCEEVSSSKGKSDVELITELPVVISEEKCVQTGDTLVASAVSTDITSEQFVSVDGSYLNILFHNLSFPQIFSKGKQYDVNEEALKKFVHSANNQTNLNDIAIIDKFMESIKNKDSESSSSASTARSLVDELDQYYKDLTDNKELERSPDRASSQTTSMYSIKDSGLPEGNNEMTLIDDVYSSTSSSSTDTMLIKDNDDMEDVSYDTKTALYDIEEEGKVSQATSHTTYNATSVVSCPSEEWLPITPSISESSVSSAPLVTALTSLSSIQCEAEELRKQQLAIEREIKALEEQQLVIREIPDKPPPPYTPPSETRAPKLPRMFLPEEVAEDKIKNYLDASESSDLEDRIDPFELYVKDFCKETKKRQAAVLSDEPWHPVNILPQKEVVSKVKLVKKTTVELSEVLNGVKPTVVPGVISRRSDHIDDILFTEWRRCEPEWTSLHTDEVLVKSQIFENIFQKILTETIDEYKKTVLTTD